VDPTTDPVNGDEPQDIYPQLYFVRNDMTVLSPEDEGKFLMDAEAEQIGLVTEVDPDEQVAYVDPEPGVAEAVVQGLGFGDSDGDDIEVPAEAVETVTDSELRVARDL
jgi:hypothetical protein